MTSLSAPRLPFPQQPFAPDVAAVVASNSFSGLSPAKLRLALANHPKLATAFLSMARVVLFQCAVSEREREIAIIRTGALTRSEYEWGMHVSIYGDKCGFTEPQIHELTCCPSWSELSDALWSPAEKLVVRMVDELHHHSTVSDQTWDALVATWPQDQVIELLFASSVYHMAAFFLNSAAVPLEEGSRRFPEGISQATVPVTTSRSA